jgi:hypothetical protein
MSESTAPPHDASAHLHPLPPSRALNAVLNSKATECRSAEERMPSASQKKPRRLTFQLMSKLPGLHVGHLEKSSNPKGKAKCERSKEAMHLNLPFRRNLCGWFSRLRRNQPLALLWSFSLISLLSKLPRWRFLRLAGESNEK